MTRKCGLSFVHLHCRAIVCFGGGSWPDGQSAGYIPASAVVTSPTACRVAAELLDIYFVTMVVQSPE